MIQLRAMIEGSNEPLNLNAFPMPADGDKVLYKGKTNTPMYFAHLVKITSYSNNKITFTGVNLQDPSAPMNSYGPLDLAKVHYVWPLTPSSLDGWSATNNCAILFLTNDYVSGDGVEPAKPDLPSAREDPGNKWPKGAAEAARIKILEDTIKNLEVQLVESAEIKELLSSFKGTLEGDAKSRFEAMFKGVL